MKKVIIFSLGLLYPLLSNAIIINESLFVKNGGNLNNIKKSIKHANKGLMKKSYAKDFLSVGEIPDCTATWLGKDDSGGTYILTAAHCVPYTGEETPVVKQLFFAWNDRLIAEGEGIAYVPKERINTPPDWGETSTDIAILKLPTNDELIDKEGNPVEQPIINDEFNELDKKVMFVGYGQWGVGFNQSESYWPNRNVRRLYGESVITRKWQTDHAIAAAYESTKENTEYWACTAPGDSGSAWWQDAKGHKVIVATTMGETGAIRYTVATRVSKYASWIKGIYKNVRLLSHEFSVWGYNDRKGTVGEIYQYQNPYNHYTEYFRLSHLGSDGRYGDFPPIDKYDNQFWDYFGPYAWGDNDRKGKLGTFFIYDNPHDGDRELFKLISVGSDGRYGDFPTDKSDNEYWEYFKDVK